MTIRHKPPCRGCEERKMGCHDQCNGYMTWKAELAKEREIEIRKKAEDAMLADSSIYWSLKKRKKKIGEV